MKKKASKRSKNGILRLNKGCHTKYQELVFSGKQTSSDVLRDEYITVTMGNVVGAHGWKAHGESFG